MKHTSAPTTSTRRRLGMIMLLALWLACGTSARAQCVGACGTDDAATDLLTMTSIALGTTTLDQCLSGDTDINGSVAVNEILAAVNSIVTTCLVPTPTDTPTHTPTESPTEPATATQTPPSTETATSTPTESPTESATATQTAPSTETPTDTPVPGATSTPTDTATPPAPTATPTATATMGTAVCGDNVIEGNETCDDGNTVTNPPTDTCPADCTIITCTPAGTTQTVSVSFTGTNVRSMTALLEYPDGIVQIAGTGDDASSAVSNTPSGFLVAAFDYDYAVTVNIAGAHALTTGEIFRVTFDRCLGAAPPTAANYKCTVTKANVSGVTCTVTVVP